jgi:hypothetical protein
VWEVAINWPNYLVKCTRDCVRQLTIGEYGSVVEGDVEAGDGPWLTPSQIGELE